MIKKIILLGALLSVSTLCFSDTKEYVKPNINGIKLDWCLSFGKHCGEPVAQKWCDINGFSKAIYWEKDNDVGRQSPTSTLTSHETCFSDGCDAIRVVVCYKSGDKDKRNIALVNGGYYNESALISNNALKSYKNKYKKAVQHKAFAQSDTGSWSWTDNKTSRLHAMNKALINCRKNNKKYEKTHPCKIINVDDGWLRLDK